MTATDLRSGLRPLKIKHDRYDDAPALLRQLQRRPDPDLLQQVTGLQDEEVKSHLKSIANGDLWERIASEKSSAIASALKEKSLAVERNAMDYIVLMQYAVSRKVWEKDTDPRMRSFKAWSDVVDVNVLGGALTALKATRKREQYLNKLAEKWGPNWLTRVERMQDDVQAPEDLTNTMLKAFTRISMTVEQLNATLKESVNERMSSNVPSKKRKDYRWYVTVADLESIDASSKRRKMSEPPKLGDERPDSGVSLTEARNTLSVPPNESGRAMRSTRRSQIPVEEQVSHAALKNSSVAIAPAKVERTRRTAGKEQATQPLSVGETAHASTDKQPQGAGERATPRNEPSQREPEPESARPQDQDAALVEQLQREAAASLEKLSSIDAAQRINSRKVVNDAEICQKCQSRCKLCILPESGLQFDAAVLYEVAHEAITLLPDMPPIRFARIGKDVHSFKADADELKNGRGFNKPMLVEESFADDFTLESILNHLEETFAGQDLSIRQGENPVPDLMAAQEFVARMRNGQPKLNALSLGDILEGRTPAWIHQARFRTLAQLIGRMSGAGKTMSSKPTDLESCRRFNILASDGAYSDFHFDILGPTWLRCLTGRKLFLLKEDTDDEAVAVVIESGTLFIPAGWQHAVLTLETSAMLGGMLIDRNECPAFLRAMIRAAGTPSLSNEPLPLQLPSLIKELREMMTPDWPHRDLSIELIERLESMACTCRGGCRLQCPCQEARRRCLGWCADHPSLPSERSVRSPSKAGRSPEKWHCLHEPS